MGAIQQSILQGITTAAALQSLRGPTLRAQEAAEEKAVLKQARSANVNIGTYKDIEKSLQSRGDLEAAELVRESGKKEHEKVVESLLSSPASLKKVSTGSDGPEVVAEVLNQYIEYKKEQELSPKRQQKLKTERRKAMLQAIVDKSMGVGNGKE